MDELGADYFWNDATDAIERVDPFLTIRGPEANVAPPDPALLASPAVRAVRDSVFRVTGSACGLARIRTIRGSP